MKHVHLLNVKILTTKDTAMYLKKQAQIHTKTLSNKL